MALTVISDDRPVVRIAPKSNALKYPLWHKFIQLINVLKIWVYLEVFPLNIHEYFFHTTLPSVMRNINNISCFMSPRISH